MSRRRTSNSETRRLFAPMMGAAERTLRLLPTMGVLLTLAYLLSGATVVASDEVAFIVRMGKLVGGRNAAALHHPGLMFALPRPIDEVVKVRVKKVYELEISGLHYQAQDEEQGFFDSVGNANTIDPERVGYCLTGDRNIIQALIVARYQVSDPVTYSLLQAAPEDLLRDAVMASMVRSVGASNVDTLLSEGRKDLALTVGLRAQKRLDRAAAGIDLVSIEFTDLAPPRQVMEDFKRVQNAFIDKETQLKEALKYREMELPKAQAEAGTLLREAEGYANEVLATARGDADAFRTVWNEYRKNPRVVRERLYREGLEKTLEGAGRTRFVPPPVGSRYEQFRITIPAGE